MLDTSLQLTIRGLDAQTKAALVRKASQQGLSLNRYALQALQQSAGTNEEEQRYQAMKQFFAVHHVSTADTRAAAEALAWADKASIKKQQQEERDASL